MRAKLTPMPKRFWPLEAYNTGLAHGLGYDDETTEQMTAMQADYDQWIGAATERYSAQRRQRGLWWRRFAPQLWEITR